MRSLSQDDDLKRKKLKQFFQERSVPVWERKVWPVLVLQGEVVGVLGCSNGLKSSLETLEDSNREMSIEDKIEVPDIVVWQLMGLVVNIL